MRGIRDLNNKNQSPKSRHFWHCTYTFLRTEGLDLHFSTELTVTIQMSTYNYKDPLQDLSPLCNIYFGRQDIISNSSTISI
jgi:hypothetical protein